MKLEDFNVSKVNEGYILNIRVAGNLDELIDMLTSVKYEVDKSQKEANKEVKNQ